ncbi:activating signal cointegrator 1 isoform X2 [Halictus rubicundus]|uniref:activating signal cointegrator 1 isoform X2 n=1 Tax=Halictus rubicundus TaxID=77578 RepID=UPI004036127F
METWINKNLSQVLDFVVTEDLVSYIMSMENERDLDEYLTSLLDCSNPRHRQFITDLKKQQALYKDRGYKKANNVNDESTKQSGKKKGKVKSKEKRENKQFQENVKIEKVEKKKVKYVNLYSQDGKVETVLLKGRHKCECEGKRHALINNCLDCGRIVCVQEGAGPCFFCGNLVCSPKDQTILANSTKQSSQLYNMLINQKVPKELEESIKQRDRLLECDRIGTQGTKVIDDECDYYQTNNMWLSAHKREQLKKLEDEKNAKRHMSRLDRKTNVTFDFMGREVIEEKPVDEYDEFDEDQLVDISDGMFLNEFDASNVCSDVECSRPIYVESDEPESRVTRSRVPSKVKNIVQDKEYLEMSDLGVCLSMHQPYASLLVAGIKMHEGRTWYSSHRGRLWIAATAKQPTKEDISSIEHLYRSLKNEKIRFPESYPTGCLLGCVTVTNVLPQEEYRKIYPNGESESPYVFICENFHSLPMKFPISGKHKIYKLDTKIHQAAVRMLEKAMKNTS